MSEIARQEQQREHGEAQKLAAKELMGGCIEAAVETADFSTTESGNWHDWLREEVVKALRERDAEIERLRSRLSWFETAGGVAVTTKVHEQQAEIERLRAYIGEIEKWRDEGERIIGPAAEWGPGGCVMVQTSTMFKLGAWWADRPWRKA